jgi:hypothetical protein
LTRGTREPYCRVDRVEVQQMQVAALGGDLAGGGGALDA